MRRGAIRQHGIYRQHVVAGHAVTQGPRATGVVARHAADRRAGGRRNIDRKPQPVRLELAIEVIELDPGFNDAASTRHVEIENAIEVFRTYDHDGMVDGLATL